MVQRGSYSDTCQMHTLTLQLTILFEFRVLHDETSVHASAGRHRHRTPLLSCSMGSRVSRPFFAPQIGRAHLEHVQLGPPFVRSPKNPPWSS